MRLKGWIRIAIVLSAVWMVGGTAYFWIKENQRQVEFALALSQSRSHCIGENAAGRMTNRPEMTCITPEEIAAAFKKNDLWIAMIGPTFWLIVAWITGGIAYGCFRWIRKGFATAK